MKIGLLSDLHLEFSNFIPKKDDSVEVLILAGDILVIKDIHSGKYDEFLSFVNNNFPKILYVLGNHEHYRSDILKSRDILEEYLKFYPNIQILEDEIFSYKDYNFLGCTLWTDLDKGNPLVVNTVRSEMNDYRLIKCSKSSYKFLPVDSIYRNKNSVRFIKENLHLKNLIVVSHHSPSFRGNHEMYKGKTLSFAYHNSLDEMIMDSENLKLWVHGHTHHRLDYLIENTRIVCNPRGYRNESFCEETSIDYEMKILDI